MWLLATTLHYNAIHTFVQKSVGIMDWISHHCDFQVVLLPDCSEMLLQYDKKFGKTSVSDLILDVASLPQKSDCFFGFF